MNHSELSRRLRRITPEVPQSFHLAMENTLSGILTDELLKSEETKVVKRFSGRVLALALLIVLLVSAAAMALMNWTVFENIFGGMPKNADQIMKSDLGTVTVNNVQITIEEAGYDGMSLYLLYSHRMLDVAHPIGEKDETTGKRYLTGEDLQLLSDHNVGWWIDHIWFDGKCMDMPGGSAGNTNGTEVNGEIIESQIWRLSVEDMYLDGKVEISLPIGERQDLQTVYATKDADGNVLLPENGMVTFTLDTSLSEGAVTIETPNIATDYLTLTAKVSEVVYTPILTYLTLSFDVKEEAFAAYIEKNGEGYVDENGVMYWAFDESEIVSEWNPYDLALVDQDGNEVFPSMNDQYGFIYGINSWGGEGMELLLPYIEEFPDELYLTHVINGAADMDKKIRVR